MSWKIEVTAYGSREWVGNGLRFAARDEADKYVHDLMMRWTSVTGWRSIESEEPVNSKWTGSKAEWVEHAKG